MSIRFRTELHPGKAPFTLSLDSSILSIGSCFADEIGARLSHYKLNTLSNPFGTTFNPISLHHLLETAIRLNFNPIPVEKDGIVYDYQFHSDFSAPTASTFYTSIETCLHQVHSFITTADVLCITYGTAWAYQLEGTDRIVNNCHQQPGYLFKKVLLQSSTIETSFQGIYQLLKEINPSLKIVCTVSPVRHIKDTLPLNNVSKAQLISAVYAITQNYTDCYYFPAYECLVDDLRDYRFYKQDLLHPSTEAITYIWNKFCNWCMDTKLIEAMEQWDILYKQLQHRPKHPTSPTHVQFIQTLSQALRSFPYWDTSKEVNQLHQNYKIDH